MKILAIDTSCDDTSIAIVEKKNNQIKVISSVVSSQIQIHAPYGGVYPMLAKRAHQKNLVPVLTKALKKAKLLNPLPKKSDAIRSDRSILHQAEIHKILEKDEVLRTLTINFLNTYQNPNQKNTLTKKIKVDAIAITNTPGLEPCLWQGINFAKALSLYWNVPLIPVNHIKAHLAANFLQKISCNFQFPISNFQNLYPAIGLVASGGHTELIYMPKQGTYKIIGSTRDDAAGECFDKTARILGLPYPGGPSLASQAKLKMKNEKLKIELPRPMINSKDFDFSFSGLKTAVLYNFQSQKKSAQKSKDYKIAMAKEIQQAIIDVLISKTLKASEQFKVKSIVTGGGVMANKELRKQFKFKIKNLKLKIPFFVPKKSLCIDNAVMVGVKALFSNQKVSHSSKAWQNIQASGNLDI